MVNVILCMLLPLKEKPALAFSILCGEGGDQRDLKHAVFPLGNKVNKTGPTLEAGCRLRAAGSPLLALLQARPRGWVVRS